MSNNLDPRQIVSGIDPIGPPGWLGYVDARDAVHAVRLPQSEIQVRTHEEQFGPAVANAPHRFRLPIEPRGLVYWWENPTDDARMAVDDFFARKGVEINGHISMEAKGRVASMPAKVGDRMYRVAGMRFHAKQAAAEHAHEVGAVVKPVVFTRCMTWVDE